MRRDASCSCHPISYAVPTVAKADCSSSRAPVGRVEAGAQEQETVHRVVELLVLGDVTPAFDQD